MKVLSKDEYIRNNAHILPYRKNIRNADMNKLYAMLGDKDAYLQ